MTIMTMTMTLPTTPTVVATMTTSGMAAALLARGTALVGRGGGGEVGGVDRGGAGYGW